MKENPLKPLDIPVIAFACALILAIAGAVYSGGTAASLVTIRGPDKTWFFPLDAKERVIVRGPLGETIVEIDSGRALIVSSPCDGKTCVTAGPLRKNGQWAACLPNKVFLLVEGPGGGEVDAASF